MIGYIRVSVDTQDVNKQKHLLQEHAHNHHLTIDEFIECEVSSRKSQKDRRIDELLSKLESGDTLLVAELSRLGRNMLETLNMINKIDGLGVKIIFVRQPELCTDRPHTKLLFAIYSYFAESEREYISMRTKQGLAAIKASGRRLGRPVGSKNKVTLQLNNYKDQIMQYLRIGITINSIKKIINNQLDQPLSYMSYVNFIRNDKEIYKIVQKMNILNKTLVNTSS